MEFKIIDLLELIGSLGIFLFGLKMMSESLQKVAGSKLRNILASMTSSRIKGVLTGILITAIIQSSSATTVMIVSFVNAGLLSLLESIGVIMGANIGTTITAWIISLLGFKVNISALSLPLIGLSLPLLFSKINRRRSLGEIMVGFALIFMGLEYMKGSVPDIQSNPEVLSFLASYTDLGMGSFFIFLAIGTVLTVIIQSSSATMALTLVMASYGWIGFDTAAALVLGENIGTTITANLAASIANVSAKRAARAHLIFNSFGVIWMTIAFPFFLKGIDWIIMEMGSESAFTSPKSLPIALALFHTTFNFLNVFILIWFVPLIQKTAIKLVRSREDEEEFNLKYIKTGLLSTSELSLLQAKNEIVGYSDHVIKMFNIVRKQLSETKENSFQKRTEKIEKYEDVSNKLELDIADYLTLISESELSEDSSRRIKAYLNIIDNLESVSDCAYNLSRTFSRKKNEKAVFTEELGVNIESMFTLIEKALTNMREILSKHPHEVELKLTNEIEEEINSFRNLLRKKHLSNIESQKNYKYMAGIIYNDLFSESEKMGDYVYNVCEAFCEINE